MTVFIYALAVLVILAGMVGTVLPFVPGVPLIFLGILVFEIVAKFTHLSIFFIVALSLMTVISLLTDYFSGLIGAKFSGAGLAGIFGAILGTIFGVSLFGFWGIFLGPAFFVLIFEFLAKRSIKKSAKAASYTFLSSVIGAIINVLLGFAMVAIFVLSIIF